jgi:hypothetical protein
MTWKKTASGAVPGIARIRKMNGNDPQEKPAPIKPAMKPRWSGNHLFAVVTAVL